MSVKTQEFFQKTKDVFWDIFLLYKNFFHWNGSKILIKISAFLLGLALSVPFFAILAGFLYFDPIEWTNVFLYVGSSEAIWFEVLWHFMDHPGYVLVAGILLFVSCFMFIVGASYWVALETNLYLGYTRGEKIPYFSNYYFKVPVIRNFLKLFFLGIGCAFLPIAGFLFVFGFLYLFYALGILSFDMLSWISWVTFLVSLILFLYIAYRVSFMYMLMFDKEDVLDFAPATETLKRSIAITKGNVVFAFLFFVFLLSIVLIPFSRIWDRLDRTQLDAKLYLQYKTTDANLNEEEQFDYQLLQKEFEWYSDSQVIDVIIHNGRMKVLYIILGFLFIDGVFQMMMVSFYIHFLKRPEEHFVTDTIKNFWGKWKKLFTKKTTKANKQGKNKKTEKVKKPKTKS